MRPCHSALPTLRPALEIMPLDAVWQLVWPELNRMATGPALHFDVCAAWGEQGIIRHVGHAASGMRFHPKIKATPKRKIARPSYKAGGLF